jgi:PAS domain S-box-containing protein
MAGGNGQAADAQFPTGAALREQAETRLRNTAALAPENPESMYPAAIARLLHELRVHQVELEMQNEELLRTQVELDASRQRYFDLYDLAPVAYCSINECGLIVQANRSAAGLLGVESGALIGQLWSRFLAREDQDIYYLLRRQSLANGAAHTGKLRIARRGGETFWAQLTINGAQVSDAAPTLRIVLTDISQGKQVEADLRRDEAFSLAILDALSTPIAVLDRDGGIVVVNRSWQHVALNNGCASCWPIPSASGGNNYLDVCQAAPAPASLSALRASDGIKAVLDGRVNGFHLEYCCGSSEQPRWFSMSVTPLADGVVVAHTDFTEFKRAEQAVRKQE